MKVDVIVGRLILAAIRTLDCCVLSDGCGKSEVGRSEVFEFDELKICFDAGGDLRDCGCGQAEQRKIDDEKLQYTSEALQTCRLQSCRCAVWFLWQDLDASCWHTNVLRIQLSHGRHHARDLEPIIRRVLATAKLTAKITSIPISPGTEGSSTLCGFATGPHPAATHDPSLTLYPSEPIVRGDPGNTTTLSHVLQMFGTTQDRTVAEVMNTRGSLCYRYDV